MDKVYKGTSRLKDYLHFPSKDEQSIIEQSSSNYLISDLAENEKVLKKLVDKEGNSLFKVYFIGYKDKTNGQNKDFIYSAKGGQVEVIAQSVTEKIIVFNRMTDGYDGAIDVACGKSWIRKYKKHKEKLYDDEFYYILILFSYQAEVHELEDTVKTLEVDNLTIDDLFDVIQIFGIHYITKEIHTFTLVETA